MIGSNFWKDNIQKDNIEKRTYVVFDGVDLSQYITNYSMNDFLDLDGKSSVYGAIGVREISISILGNHPKYNQVTIHHGIKVDDVWVDELLGTFNLLEPTYDEGAKETIYKTDANQYDELVTSPITTGSTPIEYLQGQSVIQVDSTDWTLGDEIIVSSPETAFYETYKEMAIDMGKSTMSFGIPRYDKLAYRNFTDIDYRVDWVFDLKQGEVMLPVNRLNLTTTLGDNVAEGSTSIEDGTMLEINNVELIRNNREENLQMMFGEVEGLSYQEMTLEYTGDPFIELGDIITLKDENDVDIKLYVTRHEFKDNGAFSGILHAQILTAEESHTNFVGEWNKLITKTVVEVDKVNQTINLLIGRLDDESAKTAQLRIDVDSITSTVENISNGNLLTNGSGELGFLGWSGGSVAKYVKEILEARTTDLRYLENLRYNIGFVPMYNRMSLSEWDISFYNNGFDVSPIAFIVPNIDHSYRAKVSKFKPFSIDVLEFNDLNRANALTANKVTNFAFNSPMDYVQFTFTPSATTQFVRFKYNRTGISPTDRLNISEVMFNRGQPKEWQPSPNNAITYTRSNITQLANEIELKVDTDGVISAINLTSEQAKILANHISLEGLTTINGHFKVLENGDVEFNNAKGTNMDISGKVTATSGKIAGFDINGNNLVGETVSLAPRSLTIGGITLTNPEDIYVMEMRGGGLTIGSKSEDSAGRFISFQDELGVHPFATLLSPNILLRASALQAPNGATVKRIGEATNRYNDIYLQNQPNVSSDTRYKSNIQDIDPLLIEIIGREVKPKQYRTIYDDKLHFGYIAQDVERALYKYCGNDKDKYAVLHKDESYMSLLYGELNVIIETYNRQENERLSDRISKLERLINDENKN